MNKKLEIEEVDFSDGLTTPERRQAYLNEALNSGDDALFVQALGDVLKAVGDTKTARLTGLSRSTLNSAVQPGRKPQWPTITKMLRAFGLEIELKLTA